MNVPVRQWVWPTGHTYTLGLTDSHHFVLAHHPAGAWWWRYLGELRLRPVPGTAGERFLTAELPPEEGGRP